MSPNPDDSEDRVEEKEDVSLEIPQQSVVFSRDIELQDLNSTHTEDEDDLVLNNNVADYIPRKKPGFIAHFLLACIVALVFANLGGMVFWYKENIPQENKNQSVKNETKINTKPTIYTYIETNVSLGESIKQWSTSWQKNGWDTQILRSVNATNHPFFGMLKDKLIDRQDYLLRAHALLAMSTAGGGYLCSITFLNEGFAPPSQPAGVFTTYDEDFGLVSASGIEYERYVVARYLKSP
jgi:hypothetical protein